MSNRPLVPKAKSGLSKFKLETAKELNIQDTTSESRHDREYMGNLTSKSAGKLGGTAGGNLGGAMMRKIIEEEELKLTEKYKKDRD